MKLRCLFVGGSKEDWLIELAAGYEKKINHIFPLEVVRLRPSRLARGSAEQKQSEESADILKQIRADDFLILCDEQGEELDSRAWSKKLVRVIESGGKRVVLVVGGPFGVGPEIRARANWQWSLSRLTLNHHMAQALVMEQIYRGLAIWKNLPYHND